MQRLATVSQQLILIYLPKVGQSISFGYTNLIVTLHKISSLACVTVPANTIINYEVIAVYAPSKLKFKN